MVSGSSVNPMLYGFAHMTRPYEPEATVATALGALSHHGRIRDCSVPDCAPQVEPPNPSSFELVANNNHPLHDGAVSPSPSTDSAAGGAVTPLVDRTALGRFSASTPQFGAHTMSPSHPLVKPPGTIRGSHLGLTSSFGHVGSEQLLVVVHPEDDDPAAAASAEAVVLPANGSSAEPTALPDLTAAAETTDATHPDATKTASGILLPPLPPLAPSSSYHPPTAQPPHLQTPNPMTTPPRPRLASATFGHGSTVAGMSPAPSDGPAVGSPPVGSLADHITRTTSLPLLMGSAVIPQGVSVAIPIAIAGVGTSGRARATTIHTPLAASAGLGAAGGLGGAAAPVSGGAAGHRGVAQSVDHHFIQQHLAAQQQQQQAQLQQQFLHQSDGGAGGSSQAHFIGSLSPTGASYKSILCGTPPPGHAATDALVRDVSAALAAEPAAPDALQRSPYRPPPPDGLTGSPCLPSGGNGTPMSFRSQRQGPSAARLLNFGAAAQPPDALAPGGMPDGSLGSPSRFYGPITPMGQRGYDEEVNGPEDEEDFDPMDRASSLTSSSCGTHPQYPSAQLVGPQVVQARPQLPPGHVLAVAGGALAGDTDGDEEFEDAVEVQHDDDDHVAFRRVSGRRSSSSQGGERAQAPQQPVQTQLLPSPPPPAAAAAEQQPRSPAGPYTQAEQLAQQEFSIIGDRQADVSGGGEGHGGAIGSESALTALPAGGEIEAGLGIGGVGAGVGVGMYGPEGAGFVEGEDEDEELLDEDEEALPAGHDDLRLGEEKDEGEEDLEEEEDVDVPYGGASWGAPAAPYISSYAMEQTTCVNCTRLSFGSVCRYCGHPAHTEVVLPELLEGAVRSMLAGDAATRAAQHAQHDARRAESGVLLAYDDRCRAHLEEKPIGNSADMGRSHPERPERVAAIMVRLQAANLLERFVRITGREASLEELVSVHDVALVEEISEATEAAARQAQRLRGGQPERRVGGEAEDTDMTGMDWFSPGNSHHILDCYFNASTAACARLAAGSAAEVARRVVAGAARHGAAIIRPPGHHAESSVAMGFCYYNNAAVAARAAQAAGARRVVIMDWDVHHGNGTQNIFYDDPSVLYMSTHRYDSGQFYPGTGDATEIGSGAGAGYTVNVPWNVSVRDADMLAAFRHVIVPIAADFRPDLVIVSAGFDAVEGDPLGGCRVSPAAFSHFAAQLSALAPTVLLLEGGYNLTATAAATEGCMRVLLGEGPAPLGPGVPAAALAPLSETAEDPWVASGLEGVSDSALESLRLTLRVQSQYWLVGREHQSLVEAAVRQRRQEVLLRMQQQPLQPREQWGWHVQMPQAPAPPAAFPDAMADVRHGHRRSEAAGHVMMVGPGGDGAHHALVRQEGELAEHEGMVAEHRRRMDVSTSGVMDLGDVGLAAAGSEGDVTMG